MFLNEHRNVTCQIAHKNVEIYFLDSWENHYILFRNIIFGETLVVITSVITIIVYLAFGRMIHDIDLVQYKTKRRVY